MRVADVHEVHPLDPESSIRSIVPSIATDVLTVWKSVWLCPEKLRWDLDAGAGPQG
jgi:hypothetical protein